MKQKIEQVKKQLQSLGRAAVAFSGGKDSFFLLKLAVETLGKDKVTALNVSSGFSTQNDQRRVAYFSERLDFNMERLDIDITSEETVMNNSKDRCYHCKKKIFSTLKAEAAKRGITAVLDGTTFSDLDEYRPGLKAIDELHIISPLRDAQISSAEIVAHLKSTADIDEYFLTSSTCLATRFPYDFQLNPEILETFDTLETLLVNMGIYPVKVRYIPDGIRIETAPLNFARVLENKKKILLICKKKGLKFITLDIEGIKTGVWD